jgi:hypothetical protein
MPATPPTRAFSLRNYLASCMREVQPGTPEAPGHKVIDLHFMTIDVDLAKARELGPQFIAELGAYGAIGPRSTSQSPVKSYIEIGAAVGDQGLALYSMGVGEALGLWTVYTPESFLGIEGAEADRAAGGGGVVIAPPNNKELLETWLPGSPEPPEPSAPRDVDGAGVA